MYDMPMPIVSFWGKESYADRFPQIPVCYEQDFFVRCAVYDVYLALARQDRALDLFEETLLRMLEVAPLTEEQLSEKTCLAPDFVHVICARLHAKNLIDGEGRALAEAAQQLAGGEGERRDLSLQIVTLPESGALLPLVLRQAFAGADAEEGEEKSRGRYYYGQWQRLENGAEAFGYEMTFAAGEDIGTLKDITGLGYAGAKRRTQPPRKRDVRRLLLQGRIAERYALRANNIEELDISPRPSSAVLHCKFVLQDGAVDTPILSSGDAPMDNVLRSAIVRQHDGLLRALLRGAQEVIAAPERGTDASAAPAARYPEIHACFDSIEDVAEEDAETERLQGRKDNVAQQQANARACCSAAEWILDAYLKAYPLTDARRQELTRKNQNRKNLREMAVEIAGRLGIRKERPSHILGTLNPGRIRQYQKTGVPALATLGPLMLFSAVDHADSPAWRLSAALPDVLPLLDRLLQTSGLRHGGGEKKDAFDDWRRCMQDTEILATTLLPDFSTGARGGSHAKAAGTRNGRRIRAISTLEAALGASLFEYGLAPDIKDLLIDAELCPPAQGSDLVLKLSKSLELFFRMASEGGWGADTPQDAVVRRWAEKTGAPLPKTLANVGAAYYEQAMLGGGSTLGAEFLAFLAKLPDAAWDKIPQDEARRYTETLDRVLSRRGHGNDILQSSSADAMRTLRQDIYAMMKGWNRYE